MTQPPLHSQGEVRPNSISVCAYGALVSMVVLLGTGACTGEDASDSCATDHSTLVGRWQGAWEEQDGDYYGVSPEVLEFSPDAAGRLTGKLVMSGVALANFSFDGRKLQAQAGTEPSNFSGHLSADESTLHVEVNSRGRVSKAVFKKGDAEFQKYAHPRVTVTGEPDDSYNYQQPEPTDDGWTTSTPAAEGMAEEPIRDLVAAILQGKYVNVHSLLIVKNGKIVVEEYFYGYHCGVAHTLASGTKSLTSMIVGIALDQGMIEDGLDQRIDALFPDYAGRKWIDERYPITLRHVLSMTDGLDWEEESVPYTDPRNSAAAMLAAQDWTGFCSTGRWRAILGPSTCTTAARRACSARF